jgi:hypothetical protein
MSRLKLAFIFILCLSNAAVAQSSDQCHVYVVDVAVARKAFENFRPTGDEKVDARAMQAGTTILGMFSSTIGEEVLTTRTYPFPGSKLIVTASVYYTDEMMPGESMLLGIVVSEKAQESALYSGNNAVAEVAYDEQTRTVRAKKMIEVNGRSYLVGLQCDHQSKATADRPRD